MKMPVRRLSVRQRNEAYATRMLAALVGAIALAIAVVRLPIAGFGDERVGWQVISPDEVIALENVRFEAGLSGVVGLVYADVPPQIDQESLPETADSGGEDTEPDIQDTGVVEAPAVPRTQRLERLVLAAAETMPEIRGGLGAYYINIEYPQKAIDAGVEGRLVLDFVVETSGRPSEIQVYKSLHPLCDSAAVKALRKTLFMPGRSGGQVVAVRMRLPVLFQITPPASSDSTSTKRTLLG